MTDLNKTERYLNLLYIIKKNPGIKSRELAEIFEISIRTIQRDIKNLRHLGFDLDSSTGAAGGFAARGKHYLKPLCFSGEEAAAVFVASKVLLEQKGFPYQKALKSALDKISESVTKKEDVFHNLESKTSILMKNIKDYYPWSQDFTDINTAILEQKTIQIEYDSYSSQSVISRSVDTYHMMFRDGFWYLIGYCHTRKEIRIFRLDRIKNLKIKNHKFQFPKDFTIKGYLKDSWQMAKGKPLKVKILFYPPVSRLIMEGKWHSSQVIEELSDNKILFSVTVEGTWEIKKWILGWGEKAICLEPKELREEISNELKEMIGKYESEIVNGQILRKEP